jgi:hypothetical protein
MLVRIYLAENVANATSMTLDGLQLACDTYLKTSGRFPFKIIMPELSIGRRTKAIRHASPAMDGLKRVKREEL